MITLVNDELGEITLRSDPYVVTDFQISSPAVRAVTRNRALMNGTRDDTAFTGARAVTVGITLNDKYCGDDAVAMQDLFDALLPFTVVRRRSVIRWSLPGSGGRERQMIVRGDSAPMVIAGPKHPVLSLSFVAPEGEINSAGAPICQLIEPAVDTELGRAYDLTSNRAYPTSSAVGDRLIDVDGNEQAHWTATIFGDVTNPYILINGVRVEFSRGGGLVLPAGNHLQVDTREKIVRLNSDPLSPRFDRANFTEWTWPDILLRPRNNTIRFGGAILGVGAAMNFCYQPTWAG